MALTKVDAQLLNGAVTADSSGNVGIGTSSPTQELHLYRSSGATDMLIEQASSGNAYVHTKNTSKEYAVGTRTDALAFFDVTADAERMRIDSSGNSIIGTTTGTSGRLQVSGSSDAFIASYSSPSAGYFFSSNSGNANCVEIFQGRYDKTGLVMSANNTGTVSQISFFQTGTSRGSITTNNANTAYNTSSDYRLKDNIAPMTGALATVSALKPCTYTWKESGQEDSGFIAHELQEVCPSAVTGEKDAVNEDGTIKPQQIDTSFLVATLTAAIQELKAELDATKAEVAALKAGA